jgi:nitrite reductase/ring-hydroxylating ferredoxin subunit
MSVEKERLLIRPGRSWLRRADQGRRVGADYHENLAEDKLLPPEDMRHPIGAHELAFTFTRHRYVSRSFHDREVRGLWSHVWQMACREEEIPEAGDISVYEIAASSFLVVRGNDLKIRAFRNTCRHRGMKLCGEDTSVAKLRCPFHGFTWNLEGELIDVPMRWDFPDSIEKSGRLSEVQVGLWGGFVFINPDPEAPSLESSLEVLPEHLSGYLDHSQKYIAAHFRKIFPCNWKLGIEAFLESYHTMQVHPEFTGFLSDENGQYDLLGRHVSRFLLTIGQHTTQIAEPLPPQAIVDEFFLGNGLGAAPLLPEGMTPRAFLADYMRKAYTSQTGRDYTDCPEAYLIDSNQYFLFPNIILWRTLIFPAVYRVRPNGNDPHSCIFDLYLLGDVPASGVRPPPAELVDMGDRAFTEVLKNYSVLLGQTYQQDYDNLVRQQQGMAAFPDEPMLMARTQEIRIKHLEMVLDEYLDQFAPEAPAG